MTRRKKEPSSKQYSTYQLAFEVLDLVNVTKSREKRDVNCNSTQSWNQKNNNTVPEIMMRFTMFRPSATECSHFQPLTSISADLFETMYVDMLTLY